MDLRSPLSGRSSIVSREELVARRFADWLRGRSAPEGDPRVRDELGESLEELERGEQQLGVAVDVRLAGGAEKLCHRLVRRHGSEWREVCGRLSEVNARG
jgi:hypothetical protein